MRSMVLEMALRNVLRNPIRTFFTIFSVTFGIAILFWIECLLAGRTKSIVESITTSYTGDLQIIDRQYAKDRLIRYSFEPPGELASTLPADAHLARRIHLPAIASSGEDSLPIVLEGIEPEAEPQVTRVRTYLKEGEYLQSSANPGQCEGERPAYVGRALAKLLGVELGDKIVVMAQSVDGSLGSGLLRIRGIFESGADGYEKQFIFTPIACAAEIGGVRGIHEIVVKLADPERDERSALGSVRAKLPETLQLTTWREAVPPMAVIVQVSEAMFLVVSAILFAVITLGVLNSLLMSILERTREFGVMIALGTRSNQLRSLVVAESLVLCGIGSLLGIIIGVVAVSYHRRFGFDLHPLVGNTADFNQFKFDFMIYPIFRLGRFVWAVAVFLLLVGTASLYPAWRVCRLKPVEAIRS